MTKFNLDQLWAKRDRSDDNSSAGFYHPLLYHMLDVAAVARLIWDEILSERLRKRLSASKALGERARERVIFFGGAHDIGKANPSFQRQSSECRKRHEFISARVLMDFFSGADKLAPPSARLMARIAGGHHGVFPRSEDLKRLAGRALGDNDWSCARNTILEKFAEIVGFDVGREREESEEVCDPAVVPIVAGLISVADWIGSNERSFPYAEKIGESLSIEPEAYWGSKAQPSAIKALKKLGWTPAARFAGEVEFEHVFRGKLTPNAMQSKVVEALCDQNSSRMMIIEAPMGEGKTEAALYGIDVALARGSARGFYIAMPTRAMSDALYDRTRADYLSARGHEGNLNLRLVHGDALLARRGNAGEGEVKPMGSSNIDAPDGALEAQSWFMPKKRALLTAVGIGTIDQALLSVTRTRHWFVRLFGLAGKVVVFDEVHAYDVYTGSILKKLLSWLGMLDSPVILLSATLPASARVSLAEAYYSGEQKVEMDSASYPRITLIDAPTSDKPTGRALGIEIAESRALKIGFVKTDPRAIVARLEEGLIDGGCAALICNTVDRAIALYKACKEKLADTEVTIFHARTLKMWRRAWEEDALSKFGKGEHETRDGHIQTRNRPHRAVLVATQVIEQSLDLDFDLMISEMAPIDLLLQRSGRAHRHTRLRPRRLEESELIVAIDADRNGAPPKEFKHYSELVYDREILLRSWLCLRELERIEIPSELEGLIESVYGGSEIAPDDSWRDALGEAKKSRACKESESGKAARKILIGSPRTDPFDLIDEVHSDFEDDDDPKTHKTLRVVTREGNPSITLVAVESSFEKKSGLSNKEIRYLLDRSVGLSSSGIYQAALDLDPPEEWRDSPALRFCRRLCLDESGRAELGNFTLTFSKEMGVEIEKKST